MYTCTTSTHQLRCPSAVLNSAFFIVAAITLEAVADGETPLVLA